MTELLTAAQMRAIEAAAIASGEVTGLELMERAGRGVVEAVFAEWPDFAAGSHRAVVLCGPGGNGGDGFVVARLLMERGWEVEVFLYGDPEKMPPDARVNYERWVGIGEVRELTEDAFRDPHPVYGHAYAGIYVDAVFGAGISRPLEGEAREVLTHMSGRGGDDYASRTVAIDAPSGLCLDSGMVLGMRPEWFDQGSQAVAALTVTFDSPKAGHFLGIGPNCCRKVVIKDIGIAKFRETHRGQSYHYKTRQDLGTHERPIRLQLVPTLPKVADHRINMFKWTSGRLRKWQDHKYSYGHALILSGPPGHGGAARLAGRGALRIGAGVVTVGAPADAIPDHAAHLNAIMLRRVGDAVALAEVLEDRRINAVCVGPGMGVARAKEMLGVVLGERRGEPRPTRGVVIDADALTALAEAPELFARLHEGCVLTPHGGEFARVFPDIAARLAEPAVRGPAYSKVDATREAAARAGCVVLFKGADTVIASPDGRCSINSAAYERSAPWLATAGSGDVLAGFITGLLARGFAPMQAAETAAWLHVECARSFGPGLIAEDLPEELPKVFRSLGM